MHATSSHHSFYLPYGLAEAYRAAVDLSAHDFRAWYGLGQAYELLKMPYYALYYYRCVRGVMGEKNHRDIKIDGGGWGATASAEEVLLTKLFSCSPAVHTGVPPPFVRMMHACGARWASVTCLSR